MKRTALFVAAVAAVALPCFAQSGLDSAFTQLSQTVARVSGAQKIEAARGVALAKAAPAPKAKEFHIRFRNGYWDGGQGNGWPLNISVQQGDHVKIHLENWSWNGDERLPGWAASFEVDGLSAVVDGHPAKNIRARVDSFNEYAEIEFDAAEVKRYRIYIDSSRFKDIGEIIVSKKK